MKRRDIIKSGLALSIGSVYSVNAEAATPPGGALKKLLAIDPEIKIFGLASSYIRARVQPPFIQIACPVEKQKELGSRLCESSVGSGGRRSIDGVHALIFDGLQVEVWDPRSGLLNYLKQTFHYYSDGLNESSIPAAYWQSHCLADGTTSIEFDCTSAPTARNAYEGITSSTMVAMTVFYDCLRFNVKMPQDARQNLLELSGRLGHLPLRDLCFVHSVLNRLLPRGGKPLAFRVDEMRVFIDSFA